MLAGALSAWALLAGCSSSPGPLGDGGTPGQQCIPAAIGKAATMGIWDLDNSGRSLVRIDSITLPGSRGLRMTAAWLVPVGHQGADTVMVGAGFPYPPQFSPLARSVWAQRRPLLGAVIAPGKDLNLVFGLIRTTSRPGRSDGPKITYTAGGQAFSVSENVSVKVAARC